MNGNLSTWLLAGALAASLAWNARGVLRSRAEVPAQATCGTSSTCFSPDVGELGLTDEQRAALTQWQTKSCVGSARAEQQARERSLELCALLAEPKVDPSKCRALADEIGELRARAVDECVEAVLLVREVLTPVQIERLLGSCCTEQVGDR